MQEWRQKLMRQQLFGHCGCLLGMGHWLAAAVGHCTAGIGLGHDAYCAGQVSKLIEHLSYVSKAGIDLSTNCVATAVGHDLPRLYTEDSKPIITNPTTTALAAFVPVTAIVGFGGGLAVARHRRSRDTDGVE